MNLLILVILLSIMYILYNRINRKIDRMNTYLLDISNRQDRMDQYVAYLRKQLYDSKNKTSFNFLRRFRVKLSNWLSLKMYGV
jgi:hypothetical protein